MIRLRERGESQNSEATKANRIRQAVKSRIQVLFHRSPGFTVRHSPASASDAFPTSPSTSFRLLTEDRFYQTTLHWPISRI
jgi:hypothetical protein